MFDLVPFTGAWRKMADTDPQAGLIREALHRDLPEVTAAAVAATAVGSDEQFGSVGIRGRTHLPPPLQQRRDGELRSVMVDPHAHPAFVLFHIVDPIRDRLALGLAREVVGEDPLRMPFGLPFLPRI